MVTFVMWGIGGIFTKLASNHINAPSIQVFQLAGSVVVLAVLFWLMGWSFESNTEGMKFALLMGVTSVIGFLFYIFAIQKGSISVATTISALYPLVTILLASVLFKEAITLKQGVGMALAIVAMVLMAS